MRAWSAVGVALVSLGLGLACGSSDVASPFTPTFPRGTGGKTQMPSGGEGGAPPSASGGQRASGGAAGEGGLGGAAGEPSTGTGGSPTKTCETKPPRSSLSFGCGPGLALQASSVVPIDRGASALVSATPDQRVILGRTQSPLGDTYYIAERVDTAGGFAPARDLVLAELPAALSSDGLRLVLISEDRLEFSELVRSAIGAPFTDPADKTAFAAINARVDELAHVLITAVITPDDLGLAYATFDPEEGGSRIHWASRASASDPFGAGSKLEGCALEGYQYQSVLPTSFSADNLAMFIFDEVRDQARVAYRESVSGQFAGFVDLEDRARVVVNGACDGALLGAALGNAAIRVAPLESSSGAH